jgi:hypothetical protein
VADDSITFACDICSRKYLHGLHRYEGHRLKVYGDVMACDSCWQGNHDGWAPHHEPVLLAHLKRQGLPVPARNASGLLPRGDN